MAPHSSTSPRCVTVAARSFVAWIALIQGKSWPASFSTLANPKELDPTELYQLADLELRGSIGTPNQDGELVGLQLPRLLRVLLELCRKGRLIVHELRDNEESAHTFRNKTVLGPIECSLLGTMTGLLGPGPGRGWSLVLSGSIWLDLKKGKTYPIIQDQLC